MHIKTYFLESSIKSINKYILIIEFKKKLGYDLYT